MNLSEINALFHGRHADNVEAGMPLVEPVKVGRVFARDAVEQRGEVYRYKAPAEEDKQFPLNRRKRNRIAKADAARQQKKGQRSYVRQQLEEERAVDDLWQFIAIVQGDFKVSDLVFDRALLALELRAETLVEQGAADNVTDAREKLCALVGR